MSSLTDGTAPDRGTLPAGYQEVLYWRISGKSHMAIVNLLGLLLLPVWAWLFCWLADRLGHMPVHLGTDSGQGLLVLMSIVLTVILHELVHGIAMQVFDAPVRYGVLWKRLVVYATSPGHAFLRTQYMVTCLAPLVSLSLLAVLGMMLLAGSSWIAPLAICAIVNAAGAVGDLWILSVVLRYPSYAYVIDEQDGMRIFLPSSRGNS